MAWRRSFESREARGYGREHQAERAKWVRAIERGQLVLCHFCGKRITHAAKAYPGDQGYLHLDHTEDRTGYRGPSHCGCNVRDAARRGRARQIKTDPPRRTPWRSRVW